MDTDSRSATSISRRARGRGTDSPAGDSVLISDLPMATGTYTLTPTFTADLWNEATRMNQDATQGSVVIDEISSTTITNNHVSGAFEVTICP